MAEREERGYIPGRARLYGGRAWLYFCNENSGHLRFCLQPMAEHAFRSDQNISYPTVWVWKDNNSEGTCLWALLTEL
jgi:hypothetical protein